MKRTLLALTICALLLPAMRKASADPEVSVDFFYNNLNGGDWIDIEGYGYCWHPSIADDPSWRPYADGYWAYTDLGWTWVSYEDFGWATYHYGRWTRLADIGWVWVPGSDLDWGPAWVSWRTGGDYIGWAPLPPRGPGVVYEGRPISGQVDIEFDIGPAYYNFCDVRYIGEPVLRGRIVDVNQNVTYINRTVNVTNITYKNKVVYNYGPDINVVNQHSSRPIQRLKIERQSNVDLTVAAKSGGITKVHGNALVVAGPTTFQKSTKQVAPPIVKTRIAQPKLEKGWSVAGDADAQSQLKEQIKTQDLKKIPPATGGGNAAAAFPSASPAISGTREISKRKSERENVGPSPSGANTSGEARGKHKVETMNSPTAPVATGEEKHGGQKKAEKTSPSPSP
jgi:hypothetical protein